MSGKIFPVIILLCRHADFDVLGFWLFPYFILRIGCHVSLCLCLFPALFLCTPVVYQLIFETFASVSVLCVVNVFPMALWFVLHYCV